MTLSCCAHCLPSCKDTLVVSAAGGSVLIKDVAQPPVIDHNNLCHDSDGETRIKSLISDSVRFQINNEVNLTKRLCLCDHFEV